MIAILTGDIVNSEQHKPTVWMPVLQEYLSTLGATPKDWEIFRGDEFQIKTTPEKALEVAVHLKALLKSVKGLDVRIGIGLGEETFQGDGVSTSNGSAYVHSGHIFEQLKERKINLAIASENEEFNATLNFMFKLALNFMDDWTPVSAEIVSIVLQQPQASQIEIAADLKMQQSAVSQRQKRARLDLVWELLEYYTNAIKKLA